MSQSQPSVNVGFLTVVQEATGYLGGYLVTNLWGRPLEFRLTTAVQPNRVQQILYGPSLEEYICGELIGKALVEKSAAAVQMVVTDSPLALPLRSRIDAPVVLSAAAAGGGVRPVGRSGLFLAERYAADAARVEELLAQIEPGFDLSEPFGRVREAMVEARRMGVTGRAA